MQVKDETHSGPIKPEVRKFILSWIESVEAKLAADAWLMYKERGRGMLTIADKVLAELDFQGRAIMDLKTPYSTEDSMREMGIGDAIMTVCKPFLDGYDPDSEIVIQHIWLDGRFSLYKLQTKTRPPEASHFANRTN